MRGYAVYVIWWWREKKIVEFYVGWRLKFIVIQASISSSACANWCCLQHDFFLVPFHLLCIQWFFFRRSQKHLLRFFPFTVSHPDWQREMVREKNWKRICRGRERRREREEEMEDEAKVGGDGESEIFEHCCYRWMFNNCQSGYSLRNTFFHLVLYSSFLQLQLLLLQLLLFFVCLTCFTSQSFQIPTVQCTHIHAHSERGRER